MPEATCYILDGKKPLPCDDMAIWQKFMDDVPGCTVAFDAVGKFQVSTTFIGINIGDSELPKFFKTVVTGADGYNPPRCCVTWEEAEKNHKGMVKAVTLANEFHEKGDAHTSSFKCVDVEVVPGELRFLLESEEKAISALPKNGNRWIRRGKVIIFCFSMDD